MCNKKEQIALPGASDADLPKLTAHIMSDILSICAECTPTIMPQGPENTVASVICGRSPVLPGKQTDGKSMGETE